MKTEATKTKIPIYYDMEFTGLHQKTQLISLGAVTDSGASFYYEVLEGTNKALRENDPWMIDNVVANLSFTHKKCFDNDVAGYVMGKARQKYLGAIFQNWVEKQLGPDDVAEFWGDVIPYDWMLLCELYGGAMYIPSSFYYIPQDISSHIRLLGGDPDVSRSEFAGPYLAGAHVAHNALGDALAIRACRNQMRQQIDHVQALMQQLANQQQQAYEQQLAAYQASQKAAG